MGFFNSDKPLINHKWGEEEPKIKLVPSTFDKDIQFLIFNIRHSLKLSLSKIGTTELDNFFIRDSYIKDLISETVYNVINSLSFEYKQLLYVYWNEEGLLSFISGKITMELTNISIKLNTQRVEGKDKNENMKITRHNDILNEYN